MKQKLWPGVQPVTLNVYASRQLLYAHGEKLGRADHHHIGAFGAEM